MVPVRRGKIGRVDAGMDLLAIVAFCLDCGHGWASGLRITMLIVCCAICATVHQPYFPHRAIIPL